MDTNTTQRAPQPTTDDLGRTVHELRADLEHLRRELAGEVRTRRLVVVEADGFERVVAEGKGSHGRLQVHGRPELAEHPTSVTLLADDNTGTAEVALTGDTHRRLVVLPDWHDRAAASTTGSTTTDTEEHTMTSNDTVELVPALRIDPAVLTELTETTKEMQAVRQALLPIFQRVAAARARVEEALDGWPLGQVDDVVGHVPHYWDNVMEVTRLGDMVAGADRRSTDWSQFATDADTAPQEDSAGDAASPDGTVLGIVTEEIRRMASEAEAMLLGAVAPFAERVGAVMASFDELTELVDDGELASDATVDELRESTGYDELMATCWKIVGHAAAAADTDGAGAPAPTWYEALCERRRARRTAS